MDKNSQKAKVSLLFFAKIREITGKTSTEFLVSKLSTLREIINQISEQYPALKAVEKNLIVAVNQHYINNFEEVIDFKENDEIALIPPISCLLYTSPSPRDS